MTLSEEIDAMEVELKSRGMSINKLCKSIGMPLSTVWRWRQSSPDMDPRKPNQTWTRVKEAYDAMVSE